MKWKALEGSGQRSILKRLLLYSNKERTGETTYMIISIIMCQMMVAQTKVMVIRMVRSS